MILEIEFSKDANIIDYMNVLQSLGDFLIDGHFIYLNSYKDISTVSQVIPIERCQYITNNNYNNIISSFSRKWCKEILYKLELLEFEKTKECQERLKYINSKLDELEKGGEVVAEKEKSTK